MICTCARHLLIVSESSYFCRAALYRLLVPPSLLHSFLATGQNYDSGAWHRRNGFFCCFPQASTLRSRVKRTGQRDGECWSAGSQRLVLVALCTAKAKPGVPTHCDGGKSCSFPALLWRVR